MVKPWLESLIIFHKDGNLEGLISVHVDDFQGAGSKWFVKNVMEKLAQEFKISKREKKRFKYTGVDVELQDDGSIVISQEAYKAALEEIPMDPKEDGKRKLNKVEFKAFRRAAGKISWLSDITRPDLAYDCLDLSTHNKDACVEDVRKMNKLIQRAKKTLGIIKYSKVCDNPRDIKILGITDASHLKKEEKTKGVMGRIIYFSNSDETKVCPVGWKSKVIQTVCKSAKAAETRALDKCVEESVYVARCLEQILTGKRGQAQVPVHMRTDSESLIESLKSSCQIEDKLLRPTIKWLKQMVDAKMVESVKWVDTKQCLADVLTKSGNDRLTSTVSTLMEVMETGTMIDLDYSEKRSRI